MPRNRCCLKISDDVLEMGGCSKNTDLSGDIVATAMVRCGLRPNRITAPVHVHGL